MTRKGNGKNASATGYGIGDLQPQGRKRLLYIGDALGLGRTALGDGSVRTAMQPSA